MTRPWLTRPSMKIRPRLAIPRRGKPATDHAEPDPLRYTPPRRLKLAAIIILCVFVAILGWGLLSRLIDSHQLASSTNAAAIPVVSVISPQSNGMYPVAWFCQAMYVPICRAPIYAQVSGYLKQWNYDIGARVQAGDVMAVIETPDLDQQLLQAEASLASALANEELAATNGAALERTCLRRMLCRSRTPMRKMPIWQPRWRMCRGRVPMCTGCRRWRRSSKFWAPFNGVVTARNTDVGALITVGGQTPLFTVDDELRLRIYVNVPQVYSAEIKPGSSAMFTVPEYPGQSFNADVASTGARYRSGFRQLAGCEVVASQVDNSAGMLHPGDYAQVHIDLPQDNQAVIVPPSALTFRDAGMEVATLGPDNHVVMKVVTIGRDLGTVCGKLPVG